MSTRSLLAALAVTAALIQPAFANEIKPFTREAFEAARMTGKPVLIDVWASWCPVCARQQPTLQAMLAENPELTVFKIDYDSQKDERMAFEANRQSTLIMFQGGKETGRVVGETDPAAIRALLAGS